MPNRQNIPQNHMDYRPQSQITTNQSGENSQNYSPQYDEMYHEYPSQTDNT